MTSINFSCDVIGFVYWLPKFPIANRILSRIQIDSFIEDPSKENLDFAKVLPFCFMLMPNRDVFWQNHTFDFWNEKFGVWLTQHNPSALLQKQKISCSRCIFHHQTIMSKKFDLEKKLMKIYNFTFDNEKS